MDTISCAADLNTLNAKQLNSLLRTIWRLRLRILVLSMIFYLTVIILYITVEAEFKLSVPVTSSTQSSNEQFRYRSHLSRRLVAELSLFQNPEMLSRLDFPLTHFTRRQNLSEFIFATASNGDYIGIVLDAIGRIQGLFPNHFIYFYDLQNSTHNNENKIHRLCNVVYRRFNFSRYPEHVRELKIYAFKPLIIHELLRIHETVFWVDSSVRMLKSDLDQVFQQASSTGRGLVMFDVTGHNIFMATHAQMYRYLPITKDSAVEVDMHGASAMFIQRSEQLYDKVIKWWFLCSLKRNCIAPTKELTCTFNGKDEYGQCHRFDQSAINILLANYFSNDHPAYMFYAALRGGPVLNVERRSYGKEQVSICENSGSVVRINSTSV